MKSLFLSLTLILSSIAAPPKFAGEEILLDFSQGHSIDIVKNSGLDLHDMSTQFYESYSYELERLIIKLPNGRVIKQNCTLGIASSTDSSLYRLTSKGVVMPKEEAYQVAQKLYKSFNLEDASKLDRWYTTDSRNKFSISVNKTTYPRFSFAIKPSYNGLYPWKVNISLDWYYWRKGDMNEARANAEFHYPPSDYAEVSLEPPSGKVYDRADAHKLAIEQWKKQNPEEAAKLDKDGFLKPEFAPKSTQPRAPKPLPAVEVKPSRNNTWLYVLIPAIMITLLILFVMREKKS